MLIDTHAHLWWTSYESDLDQVIDRAKHRGVEKIIVPGTDLDSSTKAIVIAKKYPGQVYAAVGIHPEDVVNQNRSGQSEIVAQRSELRALILKNKENVVAIGEIGTDASTEELKGCMEVQKNLFRIQCELALEFGLPVIIHTRNSLDGALDVLDKLPKMPRGQFHCFSHDEAGISQVAQRGFYMSFCGNITWSKRVAKLVPLVIDDRLLLETDSPFMLPNERNEPAKVYDLALKIAELRGQSIDEVAIFTTENAIDLFHL